MDSATSACRQNPAYCASVAGEETVVPIRGAAEVASVAATLRLLSANQRAAIEQALEECAQGADAAVNRRHLGGQKPSRTQCQEVIPGADGCGRRVTRAMQWGTEKHALALQCAQERLDTLIPEHFNLEQRYRHDMRSGKMQLVGPEESRALLRTGCGEDLVGTIVPDVIIHSGNPLEVLAIYDFKFPCPISNRPAWSEYPNGHPYTGLNQGEVYHQLLTVEPNLVAPVWGILRWSASQK